MVLGFTTWADGTCETGDKEQERQGIQGRQKSYWAGRKRQERWNRDGELDVAEVFGERRANAEVGS